MTPSRTKYILWDTQKCSWVTNINLSYDPQIIYSDNIKGAGELGILETEVYLQEFPFLIRILSPFNP
jgi:hypothetical protein